ncbi:MAG TPA: hypothetical protein VI365_04700, partial [Trebonia sp.]
ADRQEANPGTVGTAADWLLRFLLHPRPSLKLAAAGAALCGRRSGMAEALNEIAESLGYDSEAVLDASTTDFTGPVQGNDTDPGQLARACWALALLTEMFRNPMAAMMGPLGRSRGRRASASELLDLASPAALGQLAAFREVFTSTLLPQLGRRPGRWILGPTFTGSALIKADADVIAAGLLLDLKTDSKLSLGVTTIFQVIGYALLDFDDAYQLAEVGTFSARYAYLATWDLGALLDELVGHHVSLPSVRGEFRQLLVTQLPVGRGGLGRPQAVKGIQMAVYMVTKDRGMMTDMAFDPADPQPDRFIKYGPAPIPDPRDALVSRVIDDAAAGGPVAVASLSASASERGRRVLRAYGERMASLAVRRRDQDLLVRAVVAIVLGGLDQGVLEALMVMPLVENSARLLGVSLPDIFEKASAVVGPPGSANLMAWLARKPEKRTLACMGFAESSDEGGFRYKFTR